MRAAHQRFSASMSRQAPRLCRPAGSSRDRAARSRLARPPARRSRAPTRRDQRVDDRIVFRRRRDVCAAFEQRQRAAANEVDFEAEQLVCGRVAAASRVPRSSTSNSRATKRLTCGAIAISRFDSATGERGASGRADRRPTQARARDRLLHLLAEAVVKRGQSSGDAGRRT